MKMNALNKCMMEFISSHLSKDASCDLTPVFDDYQSHVRGILAQCGDAQPSATTSAGMSVPTGEQYQSCIFNLPSLLAYYLQ